MLKYAKGMPGFCDYFLNDFMARARNTLQKAAEDDFSKVNDFKTRNLRKAMGGAIMLDPLNLLELQPLLFSLDIVPEEKFAVILKTCFDLLLCYSLLFKTREDYFTGARLLRQTKKLFVTISQNLDKFENKPELL